MASSPDPSPAERLRTLLTSSTSLTLHAVDHRVDLVDRHRTDPAGHVVIELPPTTCLARHLVAEREAAARIELTDLAPTQVRDRVRGRAALVGWLTLAGQDPDGTVTADFEPAVAEIIDRAGSTYVDLDEYLTARPDPLATVEADLLCHLDTHPPLVDSLARLVPPHHLHGVHRIRLLALDRWGVVLRLETAAADRDVRLPFAEPVRLPEQVDDRLRTLVARAGRCHRHVGH